MWRAYAHARTREEKRPGSFWLLGRFSYFTGMITANTLRYTTISSGGCSYLCVMVEAGRVELPSERTFPRLSTSVVYRLNSAAGEQ